jgi:hypothetical protein
MPFRGDAGCFTTGVMGMNKGRFGQLGADGAVFFVKFGSLSTMKIWPPLHRLNWLPPYVVIAAES